MFEYKKGIRFLALRMKCERMFCRISILFTKNIKYRKHQKSVKKNLKNL